MGTLGELIRLRRMELGLTQEELAERLDENVRQSEVSRLENDRIALPRRARLEQLASALELSIGELLVRSGWAGAEELPAATGAFTNAQWQEHMDDLTQVNTDLRHRIDDLEQANEDWQRWGASKLLDLRVAEAAITQLEAVLNALPDPVVVVSPAGVVLVENEAYAAFAARHTDAPAMIDGDGVPVPTEAHPLERASRGERFTMQVTIRDGERPTAYVVSGQPGLTLRGGQLGVVAFHAVPT